MLISLVSLLVPKETKLQFVSERNNVNCTCKVQIVDESFVSSLVPFRNTFAHSELLRSFSIALD